MQIKVFPTGDGYDVGLTRREEFRLFEDGTPVHSNDQIVYHCNNEFSLSRTIRRLPQTHPSYFEKQQIVPNMRLNVIDHYLIDTDENGQITNQWSPGDI